MRRYSLIAISSVALLSAGVITGYALASSQQQETNYLVIAEFELGPNQSLNQGTAQVSDWVRILRNTGKYDRVRLFFHGWGPKLGLYLVTETSDWGAIGTLYEDILAEHPEFLDQAWGWGGHSDNIMTEIPVE